MKNKGDGKRGDITNGEEEVPGRKRKECSESKRTKSGGRVMERGLAEN